MHESWMGGGGRGRREGRGGGAAISGREEKECASLGLPKFQLPFSHSHFQQTSSRGPRRDPGNDLTWSCVFTKFAKVRYFFVFIFFFKVPPSRIESAQAPQNQIFPW